MASLRYRRKDAYTFWRRGSHNGTHRSLYSGSKKFDKKIVKMLLQ